jgi:hypothetical protein
MSGRVACALERFLKTTDSLSIVSGTGGGSRSLSIAFPSSRSRTPPVRQWEAELMPEHTHLPTMVRFVRRHVAHFQANRPRLSPAVSAKLLDAGIAGMIRLV